MTVVIVNFKKVLLKNKNLKSLMIQRYKNSVKKDQLRNFCQEKVNERCCHTYIRFKIFFFHSLIISVRLKFNLINTCNFKISKTSI